MNKDLQMIQKLTSDLKPVSVLYSPETRFFLWALAWIPLVILEFALTGPARAGYMDQLADSPRFLVETGIALLSVLGAGYFSFVLSVPDADRSPLLPFVPVGFYGVFIGLLVYGIFNPAVSVSPDGHRDLCMLQTLFFGVLPGLGLVYLVKKAAPIEAQENSLMISLAAVGLPSVFMQLACEYNPEHILLAHVLPVVLACIVGFFIGNRILKNS